MRSLLSAGDLLATIDSAEPSAEAGSQEGYAVAASDLFLVNGKPKADTNGLTDSGAVEIYDAVSRVHLYTLESPGPTVGALFGFSVSISGNTLVVGAHNSGAAGGGNVFVYNLSSTEAEL
ncbi:MAG: hypothetical protein KDA85_19785, partial [Planctomycetaceae bacterium]|nr:hypothetical protein [Planctomycetaceae bacterium]